MKCKTSLTTIVDALGGTVSPVSYEQVETGKTGHAESVRIVFDPIFATTPDQLKTAEAVKLRVAVSGRWKHPIVTRIEPATTFVRAEDYHQDYLLEHPNGYNDHYLRDFDF